MSDRTDRKHASRHDSDAHKSSDAKERDTVRSEKLHRHDRRSASSPYHERHRYRDRRYHRCDDTHDSKITEKCKDVRSENNSKDIGKACRLNEYRSTATTGSVAKETSIKATEHVGEFNWEQHRSILDAIFFPHEDMIKKGSVEYDEFWVFLQKYQAFSRKQLVRNKTSGSAEYSFRPNRFNLPEKYDKRYRVNVSLLSKDVKGLLHRRRDNMGLTEDKVATFRCILLHYVDFLQKQKFSRLAKVKRDQQNLPIYGHRQEIVDAVAGNQVVVVAGDTGCGKSTQVPQYLLSAGYTHIACTQPRRIACISLSRRVAYETLNEYGSEVAYQVRFERSRTQATRILFLTEGLLLRQIESDPMLTQYSVLVVDEVHERHIHTDFLLGVIKCILVQRRDLKLVLMSATINIDLFSTYFDNAPVCRVPGRLFPIQMQYLPIDTRETSAAGKVDRFDPSPYIRVLQSIDHKYPPTERGDVLIFLSGMSDIMAVVEAARAYAQKSNSWIILPLHSALSVAEQDKVFDFPPERVRKCIVSTNIAETSVTIDGIRFVVDSGKVKEMSFDAAYKMQRLQEFWISGASAEQRKGRAGRTGPGVCYRLYAESDYDSLQEYSTPEIQRVPLDSLILQMISMGLPDARRFPFIEPPPLSTIETSIAFLKEQGALADEEKLTTIGEMLAQLPVDIIIGKMLIMASAFDMIDVVLTIAAALCVQSIYTARAQRDYDASTLRKSLESDHGDPLTLLNAVDEWLAKKAEGSDSRKWCRRRGLEEQRFYEVIKLKQQFHGLLSEHGLLPRHRGEDDDDEDTGFTAVERRQKHANRRRLRELRREQKKHTKKHKVLKMDDADWTIDTNEDDDASPTDPGDDIDSSIRDLEFRLTNDVGSLYQQQSDSRKMTLRDMTLLKVILCSGLYPQVAIADEHNSFKRDSDQVFHTRNKGFVLLHPTSVFCNSPESLQLKESQVKEPKGSQRGPSNRGQLSNSHQLVAFTTLVETTKPYLVGAMRVPALPTLLLFAQSVDTNADCTRLVCDGWLEMTFESSEDAQSILSAAVKLRTAWQQLLNDKLEFSGHRRGVTEGDRDRRHRATSIQSALRTKLAEFLHSNVYYYIRRIHTAEQSHLYRGRVDVSAEDQPNRNLLSFITGGSGNHQHPVKGGTVVAGGFLVYDCLLDDETSSIWGEYTTCLQRHWTCPRCEQTLIVTVGERLEHEQQCEVKQLEANASQFVNEVKEQAERSRTDALRRPYHCSSCDQQYNFTTTEALKHKKNCTVKPKDCTINTM